MDVGFLGEEKELAGRNVGTDRKDGVRTLGEGDHQKLRRVAVGVNKTSCTLVVVSQPPDCQEINVYFVSHPGCGILLRQH